MIGTSQREMSVSEVIECYPQVGAIGRVALMITDDGDDAGFCSSRFFLDVLRPAIIAACGGDVVACRSALLYVRDLLPDCRHVGECAVTGGA